MYFALLYIVGVSKHGVDASHANSVQLKTLIDHFCAFNTSIQRKRMKSALLSVVWNDDNWTFEALEAHYKTLVRYLNLTDMCMVLGTGCGTPDMTRRSKFPKLVYELGIS